MKCYLFISSVKANAGTVHEQSAIDFFTKLLEEKDQLISHLKTQNDVLLVILEKLWFKNNFPIE